MALEPAAALALWTDLRRWPDFVEGFARVASVDRSWPATGSELVWETVPDGRGRVSERVEGYDAGARIVTRVADPSLAGVQTATFSETDAGSRIELELDYELASGGALQKITDVLFIRRALAASLARTLNRFATEADDQASAD